MKSNEYAYRKAPQWNQSSAFHTSTTGLNGTAAASAGCGSRMAASVSHPGYDVPHTPTLPVFPGTCLTSQSIVSHASVVSSVAVALYAPRGTRYIAYSPS